MKKALMMLLALSLFFSYVISTNAESSYSLLEGESKSYTVEGESFEVELSFVDQNTAKFTVASEISPSIRGGSSYFFKNGLKVTVTDILYNTSAGGGKQATFDLSFVDGYVLSEGESGSFLVKEGVGKGGSFDVELVFVGQNSVKFAVTGETSLSIGKGNSYVFDNGLKVTVKDILYEAFADGSKQAVFDVAAVYDYVLSEGESKSYVIDSDSFTVELSYTSQDTAKFTVDGETSPTIREGGSYIFSNNLKVTIIDILYDTTAGGGKQATFDLSFVDGYVLSEGSSKSYTVDGKSYTVQLSYTSQDKVKFASDGETSPSVSKGGSYVFSNGLKVTVTDILYGNFVGGVRQAEFTLIQIAEEEPDDKEIKTQEEEEIQEPIITPPTPIKIELDECETNKDCDDNNACTSDLCSGTPKKCSHTEVSLGCNYNGNCVPISVRADSNYCDIDKTIKSQLDSGKKCNNNYECSSNICASNECISPNFIQKIMNWFKRLFG